MSVFLYVAEYQLLSDMEGKSWAYGVLDEAKHAKKIQDYSVIDSFPGAFGLQLVIFTVVVPASDLNWVDDNETIKENARKLLNEIVGDTDVELRWICQSDSVT